jgi:hypothetical protein
VKNFYPVSSLLQTLGYLFRDHYRAVLASGAAEGDCQVTFAFMDVVGQQIYEQLRNALNEFPRLRE